MLARVAEALYWIGRYVERAENVTRLLMVTTELAVEIEGLDDELAQDQWDELLASVSSGAATELDFSPDSGLALPYVRWLLVDDANPVSVRHSLARARANARSIREALTREVFLDLNEGFRELDALARRTPRDPVRALDSVARTHRAIRTTLGSMELTLSRDEGWTFLKLGEALERTLRTLTVLQARLPSLESAGAGELPLFYARWRALLRSLASLENYRAAHGAGLDPESVLRFLLFEPSSPRSVLCGAIRLASYLDRLPRGDRSEDARREVGRLEAALRYDADEILKERGATEFCAGARERLARVHDALSIRYFRG